MEFRAFLKHLVDGREALRVTERVWLYKYIFSV